jgi:hypothetical protein
MIIANGKLSTPHRWIEVDNFPFAVIMSGSSGTNVQLHTQ